jgi:hypothetical protein
LKHRESRIKHIAIDWRSSSKQFRFVVIDDSICNDNPFLSTNNMSTRHSDGLAIVVLGYWQLSIPSGIVWNCLELSGIVWNFVEFCGILWNLSDWFRVDEGTLTFWTLFNE